MVKVIKKCFAEEQVNLGRQRELDIAKGIAIIFMVFAHAFETLAWFFDPEASMELSYGIFDQFLGGSYLCSVWESAFATAEKTAQVICSAEHGSW